MYFDYVVRDKPARFNDLRKKGVFTLMRQAKNSALKGDGLFVKVEPKELYRDHESYILFDGKNTLHLEFNKHGQVIMGTSYSTNQVKHMISTLGKEVIVPPGAP